MKPTPEIAEILSTASIYVNGNGNAPTTLALPNMNPKVYAKVKKYLTASGWKWDKKLKIHIAVEHDAPDKIRQFQQGFDVVTSKDLGFFPTPPIVARMVVELAKKDHTSVLEPSAGDGALASQFWVQNIGTKITCIEIDEGRVALLESHAARFHEVLQGDFLEYAPAKTFDRIIMNPPFTRGADVMHVLHALHMLNPETGKLVAIMSAALEWKTDKNSALLRGIIDLRGGEIIELPEESFKVAGTKVATIIVVIPGTFSDGED